MTSCDRGRDNDVQRMDYYCPMGHSECFRYNENVGYSCVHAQEIYDREYEAEIAAKQAKIGRAHV